MNKSSTTLKAPKTTKTKRSGVEWLGEIPCPTVVRSPLQGSDLIVFTLPRALPRADIDNTVGVAPCGEFIAINSVNNATNKQPFTVQIESNPVIKKFLITATYPHNHHIPIHNRNTSTSPNISSSLISPNRANYVSLGQRPRLLTTPAPVALKGRHNQHFQKKQGGDHE